MHEVLRGMDSGWGVDVGAGSCPSLPCLWQRLQVLVARCRQYNPEQADKNPITSPHKNVCHIVGSSIFLNKKGKVKKSKEKKKENLHLCREKQKKKTVREKVSAVCVTGGGIYLL